MSNYTYYVPAWITRRALSRVGAAFPHPPMEGAAGAGEETASRHERKCCICRHPERDAIEEAFLHWQSPYEIANDYNLPDFRPLYRHAHATGLYALRKRCIRFALDNLIERVNEIQVITPSSIVRAVRAYTCITDDGEWIEPPRQIIVTHVRAAEVPACDPDITQITTPKALPPRLKRIANATARLGGAEEGGN